MSQQGALSTASGGTDITLTGNVGGVVEPDGAGNFTLEGTGFIVVTGNPGTNTLTWSDDGTVATTYDGDSGSATPSANTLTIAGGTGCSTSGASSTITINLDSSVPFSFPTDVGTAIPALNALSIAGGTGCTTSGAGSTVTVAVAATVPLSFAGNSGTATPAANSLSVIGSGSLSVSGAGSTLTISGGGIVWEEVTAATKQMVVNKGYVANRATAITFTLPAAAAVGDVMRIGNYGVGLSIIAQNAGQTVHTGSGDTTTGVGGSLTATNRYDAIEIICTVANTDFTVLSVQGNWTIV
jgi:hypothetical protein